MALARAGAGEPAAFLFIFGAAYWELWTNAECRGMNVRVEIDDATGRVRQKAFLPR